MPALPTISPSQPHYDRIVAAFPGETGADKIAAYKNWLTNGLIEYVTTYEQTLIEQDLTAEREARLQAVRDSLPPLAETTYLRPHPSLP